MYNRTGGTRETISCRFVRRAAESIAVQLSRKDNIRQAGNQKFFAWEYGFDSHAIQTGCRNRIDNDLYGNCIPGMDNILFLLTTKRVLSRQI
ncbi:MAG: hypothetical protein BWY71_00945 [Planctomycetes bacterium ADurb.Bin412]|nr:MAG: hypothetical protein BWY71_00945 [Planctomycetes bacterium ADurb.Bin412]